MDDLISIIMPVYNGEATIEDSIASILCQTYQNWELLIVNDGSTDKTDEICYAFAKKDNRIILFNNSKRGVAASRNYSLDRARGNYCTFIDADDVVSPLFLEVLYKNLNRYKADISICNFIQTRKILKFDVGKKEATVKLYGARECVKQVFENKQVQGFLWNKLFKIELLQNLRLNEQLVLCEDLYYVCSILHANIDNHNFRVVISTEPLYAYIMRDLSATHNISNKITADGELEYLRIYRSIEVLFMNDFEIITSIRALEALTVKLAIIEGASRGIEIAILKKICKESKKLRSSYFYKASNIEKITFTMCMYFPRLYSQLLKKRDR